MVPVYNLQIVTGDYTTLPEEKDFQGRSITELRWSGLKIHDLLVLNKNFKLPELSDKPKALLSHLNNAGLKVTTMGDGHHPLPKLLIGMGEGKLFPTELPLRDYPESVRLYYPNVKLSVSRLTNNIIIQGNLDRSNASITHPSTRSSTVRTSVPINNRLIRNRFRLCNRSINSLCTTLSETETDYATEMDDFMQVITEGDYQLMTDNDM